MTPHTQRVLWCLLSSVIVFACVTLVMWYLMADMAVVMDQKGIETPQRGPLPGAIAVGFMAGSFTLYRGLKSPQGGTSESRRGM